MAARGAKTDKGFKEVEKLKVAKRISSFVGYDVSITQVHNHIRKWRNRWTRLAYLKGLSGALWDDDKKMVVLEEQHYLGHTQVCMSMYQPFLKGIMLKLGFQERWVNLIMKCVSTVEYRVRINDEETESFKPTRGLRQGDPLSPYLFLLCTEGLTALLAHAEEIGNISGVKVCREAPTITNLLFADDSLILMKANQQNAETLKSILDLYCAASGQMVSVEKSSIFFSPNTSGDIREQICSILNIMIEALNDKYLGLPAHVGLDKTDCFQYLIDRIVMRISGWKEKLLSTGGKEVLLKSVVQAIPTYAMSVFKIPKKNCKGITDEMSHFWWGDDDNQRRMHWMAW